MGNSAKIYHKASNLRIEALPDVLILEILFYLPLIDRTEFARGNRGLTDRLMKDVREVLFITNKKRTMSPSLIFSFALTLINNPSLQLTLDLRNFGSANGEISSIPFSRIRTLRCSAKHLSLLVRDKVKYIHDLEVDLNGAKQEELAYLSEALQRRDMVVSKLIIGYDYSVGQLPLFYGVDSLAIHTSAITSLTLHQYSNLTSLKLRSCGRVDDISSLCHIYDLHLERCLRITDIACLNHNHNISIINCEAIKDYSKSFKYSSKILIKSDSYTTSIPSVSIYSLQKVKRLELSGISFIVDHRPLPSSLVDLTLRRIPTAFSLPVNNLREILLSCCSYVLSLQNMGNIKRVTLSELNITSLEGLGWKNSRVSISQCPLIEDFYELREIDCLTVRYHPPDSRLPSLNLEEVTHFYTTYPNLAIFKTAQRLTVVNADLTEIFEKNHNSDKIASCLELLNAVLPLPTIKKVKIKPFTFQSYIRFDGRFQLLLSKYGFTFVFRGNELVLLKAHHP